MCQMFVYMNKYVCGCFFSIPVGYHDKTHCIYFIVRVLLLL